MDRASYSKNLEGLRRARLENPTVDAVAEVCPHLSKDQIAKIFAEVEQGGKACYFAAPPLRINHAHQILSLNPPWKDEQRGTSSPLRLDWSYASRSRASYEDGILKGDLATEYRHSKEAIAYAQEHWGDELILDNWKSYIDIYLDDPRNQDERGNPRTKYWIAFTTLRDWNDIINDHHAPESEVINDSIAQICIGVPEAHELKGGRGGFTQFNCANCGSGLGLSGCGSCGDNFHDNQLRCGWSTPLPAKLVEYGVARGFEFDTDPEVARKRERARWEQARQRWQANQ